MKKLPVGGFREAVFQKTMWRATSRPRRAWRRWQRPPLSSSSLKYGRLVMGTDFRQQLDDE